MFEDAGLVNEVVGADGSRDCVVSASVEVEVVETSPNFGWVVREGAVNPKTGLDSCVTDVNEEACDTFELGNDDGHEGSGFNG